MTVTTGPPVARLQLGQMLRELRERAGKKRNDAAEILECELPKISKLETGQATLSAGDLRLLIELYSIDDQDAQTLRQLAREGRKRTRTRVPDWARRYVAMESVSASICSYKSELIHGLLQTEDYTRAIAQAVSPAPDEAGVEAMVGVRRERQELLRSENHPHLKTIMSEAVIRRSVGGPEVMLQQLKYLHELADLPSVTLQILPFGSGAHSAIDTSFTVLNLREPHGTQMLYSEGLTMPAYIDIPAQIKHHSQVFDGLQDIALNEKESLALIEQSVQPPS